MRIAARPSIGLKRAALFFLDEIFLEPERSGVLTISGRTPEDDGPGGSEEETGELATASFSTTGTEIPSVLEAPLQFSILEFQLTLLPVLPILLFVLISLSLS